MKLYLFVVVLFAECFFRITGTKRLLDSLELNDFQKKNRCTLSDLRCWEGGLGVPFVDETFEPSLKYPEP